MAYGGAARTNHQPPFRRLRPASALIYLLRKNSDRASGWGAVTRRITGFTVAPVSGESSLWHRYRLFPREVI